MTVKRYSGYEIHRGLSIDNHKHLRELQYVLATDHDAAVAQAQAKIAELRGQISYNERRSDNQLRTAIALQAEIAALRGREFELARAMEEIRSAIRDGGAKPSTMLDYIDGVAAKALKPDAAAHVVASDAATTGGCNAGVSDA